MTSDLIRVPAKFLVDHWERDLPTPESVRSNSRYEWIRADDPALDELIGDAEFYADPYGPQTERDWAKKAAVALLRAIYTQRPELKRSPSNIDRCVGRRR